MSEGNNSTERLLLLGLLGVLAVGVIGLSYDTIQSYLYFSSSSSNEIDPEKKKLANKLQRPDIEQLDLNSYELLISRDIISSDDIDVTFSDIGGMESEKEDIFDNIIIPMKYWIESIKTGKQNLINCPSGLLLYGNPGTGKTMLAKAIAKEAKVSFLQVKPSTILDKYVGESEKLITAIFSLAHKLSPCIIFIDEMDTLLRQRTSMNTSNPVSATLGVFLSEWDGLSTKLDSPVVVLGSTNRPADIDPAFIRRMPLVIKVLNPDANAREQILKCILRKEGTLSDCIDLSLIANALEGFTGSDLKEVCRLASINRMKRIMKQNNIQSKSIIIDNNSVVNTDNNNNNNNNNNSNNNKTILLDQNHQLINEDFNVAIARMFTIRENQLEEKRQNLFEAIIRGNSS